MPSSLYSDKIIIRPGLHVMRGSSGISRSRPDIGCHVHDVTDIYVSVTSQHDKTARTAYGIN